MKRLLSIICTFAMVFIGALPVKATDSNDIEINYLTPNLIEYIVTDGNDTHRITINRETYVLTINGETFVPEIEEIPLTRATIDYSTAINLKYDIPWRGMAAMASAIMAVVPGLGWTIASAIVGAIGAEGEKLFITMTQYQSKESYYSSYAGIYYKKAINKNIRAYTRSISSGNLIYGPVDGGWFDPVKPY